MNAAQFEPHTHRHPLPAGGHRPLLLIAAAVLDETAEWMRFAADWLRR